LSRGVVDSCLSVVPTWLARPAARNVLVSRRAGTYPAGNSFLADDTAVRFVGYSGSNYALAANNPYMHAATDGTAIGANDPP
jgi:hypothetical protein